MKHFFTITALFVFTIIHVQAATPEAITAAIEAASEYVQDIERIEQIKRMKCINCYVFKLTGTNASGLSMDAFVETTGHFTSKSVEARVIFNPE